jgi:hypothetical protein
MVDPVLYQAAMQKKERKKGKDMSSPAGAGFGEKNK